MLPDAEHPMLFFSGGTALREFSRSLALRTSSAVYIITPFDSGGSTAALRTAFAMPAIGDVRNRLIALADPERTSEHLLALLNSRLPEAGDPDSLREELRSFAKSESSCWNGIDPILRDRLLPCLETFLAAMPATFDARNASLGNLFMAGCYLKEGRSLYPVLSFFGRLLHVRGTVLPVVDGNFHLAARLMDGSILVGQHKFKALKSPVKQLFLTVHEPRTGIQPQTPCRPFAAAQALSRIRNASLICYPVGSFYTSVMANLIPEGIGKAIAKSRCPKVFMPNTGFDVELSGLTVQDEVKILLAMLRADYPEGRTKDFLDAVLIDSCHGRYNTGPDDLQAWLSKQGIGLLDRKIVRTEGVVHDPEKTAETLLGLCRLRGEDGE